MSVVTTDDKHYKNIAAKLREKAETESTYKPAEMAGGIDTVYEAGKNSMLKYHPEVTVSGSYLLLDDVSELPHEVKCKISGVDDPTTVTVTECGKNSFRPTIESATYNGVTVTANIITGEITFNGTLTAAGDLMLAFYDLGWCVGQKYTFKTHHIGGTATLGTASGTNYAWSIFSKDKKTFARGNTANTSFGDYQFTAKAFESESYYVYLQCWAVGTVFDNFKVKIQIEYGDTATDFEVYKNCTSYTPSADGTVEGMTSVSPYMNIFTDTEGVNIEATYRKSSFQAGYLKGVEEGKAQAAPSTPTDNRTSLAYWYQYLSAGWMDDVADPELGDIDPEIYEDYWKDTLEFPKGVENVTEFAKLFVVYARAAGMYLEKALGVKEYTGSLDMSKATSAKGLLEGFSGRNYNNITLPDTSKFSDFSSMFYKNRKVTDLTGISLNTSNGERFSGMYYYCSELVTISEQDLRNGITLTNIIQYCKKLTSIRFKNIKANMTIGGGYAYGNLLDLDSLIFTIRELRDTGTTKTLTMGSTLLKKLENIYVRVVSVADEMRAEDDLIDEKLPFEICNSTDSGATLITDYVKAKNWTLK